MDIKKQINIRNTKPWVQANETTNSTKYREAFVKKYGGCFKRNRNLWIWSEKVDKPQEPPTKLWLFSRNDGVSFMSENFTEFCRTHNLSKSAMYELMSGKRKSHKGFVKIDKLV